MFSHLSTLLQQSLLFTQSVPILPTPPLSFFVCPNHIPLTFKVSKAGATAAFYVDLVFLWIARDANCLHFCRWLDNASNSKIWVQGYIHATLIVGSPRNMTSTWLALAHAHNSFLFSLYFFFCGSQLKHFLSLWTIVHCTDTATNDWVYKSNYFRIRLSSKKIGQSDNIVLSFNSIHIMELKELTNLRHKKSFYFDQILSYMWQCIACV